MDSSIARAILAADDDDDEEQQPPMQHQHQQQQQPQPPMQQQQPAPVVHRPAPVQAPRPPYQQPQPQQQQQQQPMPPQQFQHSRQQPRPQVHYLAVQRPVPVQPQQPHMQQQPAQPTRPVVVPGQQAQHYAQSPQQQYHQQQRTQQPAAGAQYAQGQQQYAQQQRPMAPAPAPPQAAGVHYRQQQPPQQQQQYAQQQRPLAPAPAPQDPQVHYQQLQQRPQAPASASTGQVPPPVQKQAQPQQAQPPQQQVLPRTQAPATVASGSTGASGASKKAPSFAECLYRAMLRQGPDKREKIQEAFRYFKQHQGLPHEEVQVRLVSALGKDFVGLCWKEARKQLYEAQRAAGVVPAAPAQQQGGQQGQGHWQPQQIAKRPMTAEEAAEAAKRMKSGAGGASFTGGAAGVAPGRYQQSGVQWTRAGDGAAAAAPGQNPGAGQGQGQAQAQGALDDLDLVGAQQATAQDMETDITREEGLEAIVREEERGLLGEAARTRALTAAEAELWNYKNVVDEVRARAMLKRAQERAAAEAEARAVGVGLGGEGEKGKGGAKGGGSGGKGGKSLIRPPSRRNDGAEAEDEDEEASEREALLAAEALSRAAQDYATGVLEELARCAKQRTNEDVRALHLAGAGLDEGMSIRWAPRYQPPGNVATADAGGGATPDMTIQGPRPPRVINRADCQRFLSREMRGRHRHRSPNGRLLEEAVAAGVRLRDFLAAFPPASSSSASASAASAQQRAGAGR